MKHIEWKCELGPDKCDRCNYDSHPELFTCKACGASEGELTTDCPGSIVDADLRDAVYNGARDFVDGVWIDKVVKNDSQ